MAFFAEDIKALAEREFNNRAICERPSSSNTLPPTAFIVKQNRPYNVDEAVSATLEMESYLLPKAGRVGHVPGPEFDKKLSQFLQDKTQ